MKIVSVRSQLPVRIVRSSMSALPTLLKSGCVFVASGTFVQCSSCISSMAIQVCSATNWLGKGLPSYGQVCPSPQKPLMSQTSSSVTYVAPATAGGQPKVTATLTSDSSITGSLTLAVVDVTTQVSPATLSV